MIVIINHQVGQLSSDDTVSMPTRLYQGNRLSPRAHILLYMPHDSDAYLSLSYNVISDRLQHNKGFSRASEENKYLYCNTIVAL